MIDRYPQMTLEYALKALRAQFGNENVTRSLNTQVVIRVHDRSGFSVPAVLTVEQTKYLAVNPVNPRDRGDCNPKLGLSRPIELVQNGRQLKAPELGNLGLPRGSHPSGTMSESTALTAKQLLQKLRAREIDRDQFFDLARTIPPDELVRLAELVLRWVNPEDLPD